MSNEITAGIGQKVKVIAGKNIGKIGTVVAYHLDIQGCLLLYQVQFDPPFAHEWAKLPWVWLKFAKNGLERVLDEI
jgi:hypothetical protein